MPNFTRARQMAGDFTSLEISQKAHDDNAAAFYQKQLELIESQKEYTKTIRRATIVMAAATVVMALAMIVQCAILLR